jgi:protein gp37
MSVKTSISWADLCINPITGCNVGCDFCYARKFAYRLKGRFGYDTDHPFAPTFHPDKLADIYGLAGKGKRIFLDSMGDWFSPGVDRDWITQTLDMVDAVPEHSFLVLTKRPDRITPEVLDAMRENLWLGVSVTRQKDVERIDTLVEWFDGHKFVSFEPLHGPIRVDLFGIEWVIIGAESGNRKCKIYPKYAWVMDLVNDADKYGIPVFLKNNVWPILCGSGPEKQEFPKAML